MGGLVSKELNHFGAIAALFRDWVLVRQLLVSLVPNLGKTLQSPQSDLTPWASSDISGQYQS